MPALSTLTAATSGQAPSEFGTGAAREKDGAQMGRDKKRCVAWNITCDMCGGSPRAAGKQCP